MPEAQRDNGWDQPAWNGVAATKSDTNDDPAGIGRAILIGGAGDVKVTFAGGGVETLTLAQGIHPLRIKKVWNSVTDATGIILLY